MDIRDQCKGLNERELKKIISIIDNLEKQQPNDGSSNMPSRYFLNGQEIYTSLAVLPSSSSSSSPKSNQQLSTQTRASKPPPPPPPPISRTICTTGYPVNSSSSKNSFPSFPSSYKYQGQPIIYHTTYDKSQAAQKLAQIDYYLGIAERSVKSAKGKTTTTTTTDNDECCGYRVFDKKAELKKVDWGRSTTSLYIYQLNTLWIGLISYGTEL